MNSALTLICAAAALAVALGFSTQSPTAVNFVAPAPAAVAAVSPSGVATTAT